MADCRARTFVFVPKKRFDFSGITGSEFCKIAYAKRGNNSAFAQPYNGLQADKRKHDGHKHKADIKKNLDVSEVFAEFIGNNDDKSFAGNNGGVADNFDTDADAENCGADNAQGKLADIVFGYERFSDEHPEINEHAE